MNLSRRSFLKGAVAAAGALLLSPTLTENAEAARRFWALDATMLAPRIPEGWSLHMRDPADLGMFAIELGAYHVSGATFTERFDMVALHTPEYDPGFRSLEEWGAQRIPFFHQRVRLGPRASMEMGKTPWYETRRGVYCNPGFDTDWHIVWRAPEHLGLAAHQVAAYRDRPDLPLVQYLDYPPMPAREEYVSPLVFEADAYRTGIDARHEALRLLAREMAGR